MMRVLVSYTRMLIEGMVIKDKDDEGRVEDNHIMMKVIDDGWNVTITR